MNNPKVLGGAAVGIAAILWFTPGNPFKTPGVKNVGDAWARGGGSTTNTPAVSTTRGSATDNETKHESKGDGLGTQHFSDNYASQKVGSPNAVDKAFGSAIKGDERGK